MYLLLYNNNMSRGCISMAVGEYVYHGSNGQFKLNYNEERNLCRKGDKYIFTYGTIVGDQQIKISGQSTDPQQKKEDHIFKTTISINQQKKEERMLTYSQVASLFNQGKNSPILAQYLPNVTQGAQKRQSPQITQGAQKRQITQGVQKRQIIQGAQKRQVGEAGKVRLESGQRVGYVINPETGREIKIGGETYKKICNTGRYICQ